MPWARFDETFDQHPKIAGLSDRAFRMFVCSVTWSNRNLTDGRIPALEEQRMRPFLALVLGTVDPADATDAVGELTDAGLWEKLPARRGFQIHDYLTYQPSKEKVEADREAARQRQQRHRETRSTVTNAVSHGVTDTVTPVTRDKRMHQRAPDPAVPTRPLDLDSPDPEAALEPYPDPEPPIERSEEPIPVGDLALEDLARHAANGQLPEETLEALGGYGSTAWHGWRTVVQRQPRFAAIKPAQLARYREERILDGVVAAVYESTPDQVETPAAYLDAIAERKRAEAAEWSTKKPSTKKPRLLDEPDPHDPEEPA